MTKIIKYDAVFIYETDFQKNIVHHIIDIYYKNKNILVINAINYPDNNSKLILDGYNYNLNFNVPLKYFFKSFFNLLRFKLHIKTEVLFASFVTGMNSKVWEQIIQYEKLAMIDDGLGTVLELSSNNEKTARSSISFFMKIILFAKRLCGFKLARDEKIESHLGIQMFVENLFLRIKGIKIKDNKKILSSLSYYYSIYNFENITLKHNFKTVFLKDYYSYHEEKLLPGTVGFIGQELNSLGYQDFRVSLFEKLYKKFMTEIYYYPHPREKKLEDIVLPDYVKIIKKNETIDEYFKKNGTPEILVTICSTTILNLLSAGTKSKCFYLKDINTKYNSAYVLFDAVGIKSLNFSVRQSEFYFID